MPAVLGPGPIGAPGFVAAGGGYSETNYTIPHLYIKQLTIASCVQKTHNVVFFRDEFGK